MPWGEHGDVSSTSKGASPHLQDAGSHWVSVASHLPAHGPGGQPLLHGKQVPLHTHLGRCIQVNVVSSLSLELLVGDWVFPPCGATRRDAPAPGAAPIGCEQWGTLCSLLLWPRFEHFFTSRPQTWDFLLPPLFLCSSWSPGSALNLSLYCLCHPYHPTYPFSPIAQA